MTNIPILPGALSNVTDPDNHNNTDPTIELEDTSSYNLINPSASTNPAPSGAIEASISLQLTSQSTTTVLDQLKHCLPIFNASHHNDKTEPADLKLSINSIERPPVNSVWLQDNNFLAVTIKSLYFAAYKFNDFLKDHDPFPFPAVAAQLYANLYGMQNNYNTINNFQTAPSYSFNTQVAANDNYGRAANDNFARSNTFQNYNSAPSFAPAVGNTNYYSTSYSNPISTQPSNFYAGAPLATPIVAPSYSPSFSSTAPLYSPSVSPSLAPISMPADHSHRPSLAPTSLFAPTDLVSIPGVNLAPLFAPTPSPLASSYTDMPHKSKNPFSSSDEKITTFPTLNPSPTIPTPDPNNFANTAPTLGSENFGSTHTSPTIFTEPIPEPAPSPVSGFAAAPDPDRVYFVDFAIPNPQEKQYEATIRAQDLMEMSSRLKNLFRNLYVNDIGRNQDYLQSILRISPQLIADLLGGFKDPLLKSRWHLLQTSLVAETLFKKQTKQASSKAQAKTTSSSGGGGKDCNDPAAQAEFDKIPATLIESEGKSHKGHTYERHVGKTLQDLLDRFAKELNRDELSSFSDPDTAEKAYREALYQAKTSICNWLSGKEKRKEFEVSFSTQIGYGLKRGETDINPRYKAVFRFAKTNDGPRVVTAILIE